MLLASRTTNSVVTITVSTGGVSYTSAPTVALSGGGGTGAIAVAQMAGTAVDSVRVVSGGTGYTAAPTVSFSGGGGTGASAVAYACGSSVNPMSFFRGRNGDLLGVDGMGRGIRWNGTDASAERIGLARPLTMPAITASTTGVSQFVAAIQLVNAGGGYHGIPTVTITGGSAAATAQAEAYLINGRVAQIRVTKPGSGYQTNPTVAISGGIGTGATFGVSVIGSVRAVTLTADGSGYTTTPSITVATTTVTCQHHGLTNGSAVTFSALTGGTGVQTDVVYYALSCTSSTLAVATTSATTATAESFGAITAGRLVIPAPRLQFSTSQGLTGAFARADVDSTGRLSVLTLSAIGDGATTTGVTASVTGGGGTGAQVSVGMQYRVNAVTVTNGGTGFFAAPVITVRAATTDPIGTGAAITSFVNSTGVVTGASVASGGAYLEPPTAIILNTAAQATALLAAPMGGKYLCAIRYLDDTPASKGGPTPSSISELREIDTASQINSLTWSFAHASVDDRVSAMELWRTSADQNVLLYRVATIQRADFDTPYADTLSESQLTDPTRSGYGLMPITLPSGQVNARRFEIPPPEMSVACMFQDRAWYAVDSTGQRPNALMYSEIDEPESVPPENELLLQENSDEPDRIVALVPLSSALLVAQESHLYRLTYVAQPVLDAAVVLVSNRGVLNSRCWDTMGGAAFLVDSLGMYGFDGQNEEPISIAIDDYWRDRIIDFSKAHKFHVQCDPASRIVRFYYCRSTDTDPVRALCYCVPTKSWWEETYPTAVTAGGGSVVANAYTPVSGLASGSFTRQSGTSDSGTAIPFALRTGALAITPEPDRSIGLLYKPTPADCQIAVGLHYNNSGTARPNAIASDRGSGFVSNGTQAALNMAQTRSPLAEANGFARAYFSGRLDDRSAGGDRHLAVAFSGTQSADPVALYSITMSGVTA